MDESSTIQSCSTITNGRAATTRNQNKSWKKWILTRFRRNQLTWALHFHSPSNRLKRSHRSKNHKSVKAAKKTKVTVRNRPTPSMCEDLKTSLRSWKMLSSSRNNTKTSSCRVGSSPNRSRSSNNNNSSSSSLSAKTQDISAKSTNLSTTFKFTSNLVSMDALNLPCLALQTSKATPRGNNVPKHPKNKHSSDKTYQGPTPPST